MINTKNKILLVFFLASFALISCSTQNTLAPTQAEPQITLTSTKEQLPTAEPTVAVPTIVPSSTSTPLPLATATVVGTPTPDLRLTPKYWREWPVAPALSFRAISVLEQGLLMGNNPRMFSRVGDCQSEPDVFLGIYSTDRWALPAEYASASASADYFYDAFSLTNVTAKKGFGVSSVLSPIYSNTEVCQPAETPIDCELRLRKPIVVFVAMGTNWQAGSSASFEQYLRQVVDILIEQGSLPILVNKPDNIEGDGMLNFAIAQVAYDYDLPMVNVWKALDYLPGHGLQEDGIYMVPEAWDNRNLYSFVVLDEVRQAILSIEANK